MITVNHVRDKDGEIKRIAGETNDLRADLVVCDGIYTLRSFDLDGEYGERQFDNFGQGLIALFISLGLVPLQPMPVDIRELESYFV